MKLKLTLKAGLFVILSLFLGTLASLHAQQNPFQIQSYIFSTGVGTPSSWMTPTLTYSSLITGDDQPSQVSNLGFNFIFEGNVYTQFSVNTNGNLRLGSTRISGSYYSTPFNSTNANNNTPKIVGVGADLYGTSLTYGVAGSSPNRIGVFTFNGYPYSNSSYTFRFQVQLYENTGEIRIVYDSCAQGSLSRTFQIGVGSSAADVAVVDQTTHTVSYGATTSAYSSWPGQYRYYSFVPDTIICTYPYNLTASRAGANSVSLNWSIYGGLSSQPTFILEYGVAGFAQGSGTQIAVAGPPVVINGLQQDVGYTFYVRAVCDTVDTSLYSNAAYYVICSGNNNSCLDFTNLRAPGVVCTYGKYQYYGQTSSSYPGPYADTGVVDLGPASFGRSSSAPGSRHTVNTNPSLRDPLCPQISRIPPGECASVRLGSYYGGYLCQSVSYTMMVDSTVGDLLLLKYACVFNDVNHGTTQQPRFVLEILDQQGNLISPSCGTADYSATDVSSGTVGGTWYTVTGSISFMDTIVDSVTGAINTQQLSYSSHTIRARDWTPLGFNIAAYHGQTIVVRITSYSCGQSGPNHCGYVYYTLGCAKAKIHSSSCVFGGQSTLSAPIGFNYRWFSSRDTSVTISTNRQVDVILDSSYYYCDVSFIDNPICKFRMSYNHLLVGDTLRDTINPVICPGGSFIQNGDTMTLAGSYRQELTTVGGCDSILTINLSVGDTLRDTATYSFCAGARLDVNGYSYPRAGHYSQKVRNQQTGCFTKHTVVIEVADTIRDTVRRTVCAGASFDTNGQRFFNQGVYIQRFRDNVSLCYRNLVIDLTVLDTLRDTIHRTVCAGASFDTAGSSYFRAGSYTKLCRDTTTGCLTSLKINLSVNDTLRDTIHRTVCAGASFDTNGQQYYHTGFYSQLRRDATTGCYTRLYIDLTVNDTLRDTIHRTICAGASFDTNGISYYYAGVYSQYLRDVYNGCCQNLVIFLDVADTLRDTIHRTVCAGASFDTNGHQYYNAGLYSQLRRDATTRCYTRLYIDLTVNDTLRDTIHRTVCAGASFDTNGISYYNTGVYCQYLRDVYNGCCQNLVIFLDVADTLRDTIHRTVCAGASFDTNGHQYYNTGIYSQLRRDATTRCYTRLYIDLTVADTLHDTIHRTICAGASFDTNGQQYYNTGFYSQLRRDATTGCYTRLYIDLTVNDTLRDTIHRTICAGASFDTNGISYYNAGVYCQYLRDIYNGCCQNLVIYLDVNDTLRDTIYRTICAGASFDTNGVQYTRTGFYSQLRRDATSQCYTRLYIDLTVVDTLRDTVHRTVCAGVSFDTNGVQYTRTGFYSQLHRDTTTGCYTRLYIGLTVADTLRDTIYRTVCAGASFDTNSVQYTRTGFYSQLHRDTTTGCYTRLYVDLTVADTLRDTIYRTICAGASFDTNGMQYTRTGFYSQLRRDATTRCYTRLYIDLTVVDTLRDTIYRTVCAGASFDTNGVQYTRTGFYSQLHRDTTTGCYTRLFIDLTVADTLRDTIYRTICAGASFDTNGVQYTRTGFYSQLHRDTTTGCYTRLFIDLTVADTLRDTIYRTICAGASFDTNGVQYTRTGFYSQLRRDATSQCYTRLYIDLTVADTLRDTIYLTICAGASFDTNGVQYSRTGFYSQLHRDTTTGCYTRLYIGLTVADTLRDTIYRTICAGASFDTNGVQYTRTGFYSQLRRDATTQCYTRLYIDLTVVDTLRDTVHRTVCAGVSFDTNGVQYTRTGFYSQLRRDTTTGCYTRLYVDLTVADTLRDTIYRTICAGASFDTNGMQYTRTGFYSQLHRDTTTGCYTRLYIGLTVADTLRDTIYRTVCAGASFDTNGVQYTRTGFYSQLHRDTTTGCYTRLYIGLTVADTLRDTIYRTVCAGASFDTNGVQYSRTGFYSQLRRDTTTGCYTRLFIDLTVADTLRDTIYRTICAGASFDTNGVQYTRTGFYSQLRRDTTTRCYTRLYIDLTVVDTLRDTIYRTVCAGASFDTNGVQYTRTGFYSQLHRDTTTGCYTRLYVDLTVADTLRDTIYRTICAGASFDTNGMQYTRTGFYSQLRRDTTTGCYTRLYIGLTVADTLRDTIHRAICAGASFDTNGVQYSRTGFYSQLRRDATTRCYTRLYIDLTVNDTLRDTIHRAICAGASFDTNGVRYTRTGFYSQLRRDVTSQCYTRLYIDLTVADTLRDTIYRTICAGASFDTNGFHFYNAGFYSQLRRDAITGCFNRLNINLVVHDTFRTAIWQNICAGATFTHGGQAYSVQGSYIQRYNTVYGCDSITEIHLTVADTIRDTVEHSVCAGQTVVINGQTYYRNGWYRQHLSTPNGCDSILHIHLSVADTLRDTFYYTVCAGNTVEVNGQSYYRSGWYRQDLRNQNGCDSILHIAVFVTDTIRSQVYDTICEGQSYLYNDSTYRRQGIFRHLLKTPEGCDSIVTLHLVVRDTAMTHIYDTIENGDVYNFFGQQYSVQGVYSYVLPRQTNGCDSTIVLHLKICHTIYNNVYDTICVNDYYRFGDSIIMDSGVYTRMEYNSEHCDSVIILHLAMIKYPSLSLVDSGYYCHGGVATLTAVTNGNYITWTSLPTDSTLIGQEHEFVVRVAPQRYVEYIATVDIQPYNCVSSDVISLNKPSTISAAIAINPLEITNDNLQTLFSDISIGEVAMRKWIFHEDDPTTRDLVVLDDSTVYYTPSPESDSVEVTLMVANHAGCRDTVTNIYPILKGDIWVPSAFTPGRRTSGQNYLFRVGYNNVIDYEINIYSRSGLLVFHSTNPDISWDGTHNHKDCVTGSYVYEIHYTTKKYPKIVREKTGSVLLIR